MQQTPQNAAGQSSTPKKKKKRDLLQPRIPEPLFVILWTLMNAFIWGPVALASFELGQFLPVDGLLSVILGFVLSVLFPVSWMLGQGLMLKAQYGWSLKRWILGTVGGALLVVPFAMLSGVVVPFLYSLNLPGDIVGTVMGLMIVVPFLVAQMWVLRRYVRRVWLWPIGTLTGLAIGSFMLQSFLLSARSQFATNLDVMNMIVNGSQGLGFGLVTGLVIVAMVRLTRNQPPPSDDYAQRSNDTAADDREMSERLVDQASDRLAELPSARKQKTASH